MIVAFADIDPFARSASRLLRDLQAGLPTTTVWVDDVWHMSDPDSVARAMSAGRTAERLICLGIGAGARAALAAGRRAQADTIIAWSPSGGRGLATDWEIERLAAAFADRSLDHPDQLVRVISALDTVNADEALIPSLRAVGGGIRMDSTSLIYPAFDLALIRTRALHRTVRATLDAAPPPKVRDLSKQWLTSFAHGLTIDPARSYMDASRSLHLAGVFSNQASMAMDLSALAEQQVFIGARVRVPGDAGVAGGARSGFSRPRLEPGDEMPFRLTIPAALSERAAEIEVALVCERSFWFDLLGFPVARLWHAPNDRIGVAA